MAGEFDYLDGLFEGVADSATAADNTTHVVGDATAEDDWSKAIDRVRKRIKEPLWIPVASPVTPDGGEPTPLSRVTISNLRNAAERTDRNAQQYFDVEIARYERMRRGWYIPPMAEGELEWWKEQAVGLEGEIEAVLKPKLERARRKLADERRKHYYHQERYERYVDKLRSEHRSHEIQPPMCGCVRATRGVRRAQGSIKRVARLLKAVQLRLRLESKYEWGYDHGERIETRRELDMPQRLWSLTEPEFRELYGAMTPEQLARVMRKARRPKDATWGESEHDDAVQPELARYRLIGRTPEGVLMYGDVSGAGKGDWERFRNAKMPWLKVDGGDVKKSARKAAERDRKKVARAKEKRAAAEDSLLDFSTLTL